jgi:hypothetical protein
MRGSERRPSLRHQFDGAYERPKEWLPHPLLELAWGVPLALLGVVLLMGDDPTFGAFVLLVGAIGMRLLS